ncbi:MAG: hypothetical protein HDS77_06935 [Bacteroidales bacterium]|nr:hypothetical protein [Bacteroidales bacterium]
MICLIKGALLLLTVLFPIYLSRKVAKLQNECRKLRESLIDTRGKLIEKNEKIIESLERIKTLERDAQDNFEASLSADAEYICVIGLCGYCTVIRRVKVSGGTYHSVIKEFTDEDTTLNIREAEELCDILNA